MHPVNDVLAGRKRSIGEETITEWLTIDQPEVDVFGAVTRNLDPMHNDPAYVQQTGLWGGRTVLHGLFTASLVPHFLMQVPGGHFSSTEQSHTINYGIDSLRWISPVLVGAPFRARISLAQLDEKRKNEYLAKYRVDVEQQDEDEPRAAPRLCMVATCLVLVVAT